MSMYRSKLPQLSDRLFLTDGGLETTLIFHEGIELPYFASFDLMKSKTGVAMLRAYYERYIAMAKDNGLGFVLEAHTWRANPDWAAKLGYSRAQLADANRAAIALLADIRRQHETPRTPIVISGNIGPRGDGYKVENAMSAKEAADYHGEQIAVFRDSEADMVSAFTLNYVDEALGVVRAAQAAKMPVDRETSNAPSYYMLNCAHPTHFSGALRRGEAWVSRLRGIRANASTRSHAELDAAPDLDIGNPAELGRHYRDKLPALNVLGGCCGTDHRHVGEICLACVEVAA